MLIRGFTFYSTIFALEAAERIGLPTLKGSPQGSLVFTEFGWVVAIFLWWLTWLLLLYFRSFAINIQSREQ
jgi:hypothetical protein